MSKEKKIIIPIPAKDQEKWKAILEAEQKLKDTFIALHENPGYIKQKKQRLALKKIDKLKALYLKQKVNDVNYSGDDLLKDIEEECSSNRAKMDKNNKARGSVIEIGGRRISYNTQEKYLKALQMYEKLRADGRTTTTAHNKVFQKHGWRSVGVTKKNLTLARKIRKIRKTRIQPSK